MKVELSREVAALLADCMARGRFSSESDAIAAGLVAWIGEEAMLNDVDWDHVNRMLSEVDPNAAPIPGEIVHQRVRDLIRAKAVVAERKA